MVKHFVDSSYTAQFHEQFDDLNSLEEVAGRTAVEQLAEWDSTIY